MVKSQVSNREAAYRMKFGDDDLKNINFSEVINEILIIGGGINQADLAKATGKSEGTISLYKNQSLSKPDFQSGIILLSLLERARKASATGYPALRQFLYEVRGR